ncbi:Three prime repair exonuclease 2 [Anthophora retusa]
MIRTFIFFDLETTGLIGKNFMPKVTEMSLIAVSRSAICDTTDILPRVLHKLVLPIHPNVRISEGIETLTGLSNTNLEEVQHFNCEVYNLIINFVKRQIAPICFVAYNGNKFDYPIFLSELKNINKNFCEDILSIDMLHLIKEFFSTKESRMEVNAAHTTTSNSFRAEVSILLNDGCDEILSEALDSVMATHFESCRKSDTSSFKKEKMTSSDNAFNTPQSSWFKKIQQINEKTPESQIIKLQHSDTNFQNKRGAIARRKLDFTNSKPTNFKLSSVCKHIFGTDPENVHNAEGDCLSMIRCATQLGDSFVQWADYKAVPLINHSKQ